VEVYIVLGRICAKLEFRIASWRFSLKWH